MKHTLIICGHPNKDSFCAALAQHYQKGIDKNHETTNELVFLSDLTFDPILWKGYQEIQDLEPDLLLMQEKIKKADHLVWVFPSWWGNMPALMKGFIDRTFLPGYAFKYKPNSALWEKFLTKKSARLIITMDSPKWYNWLVYKNAIKNTMKNAVLNYCGVSPVKVTTFAPIKSSTPEKRAKWLSEIELLGEKMQ